MKWLAAGHMNINEWPNVGLEGKTGGKVRRPWPNRGPSSRSLLITGPLTNAGAGEKISSPNGPEITRKVNSILSRKG